jgi:hypothetical protein
MLSGEDMKESSALLALTIYGGLTLLFAYALKVKRRMDKEQVVSDVELFLKATRLQELILPEQQEIIDDLAKAWSNANYQGKVKAITIGEWIRQNLTDTLTA